MKNSTQLRHQVGSLLIAGVEASSLTAMETAWLRSVQASGVILFRRNIESPEQIYSLFKEAAASLEEPFFRCVDVEGGTVDRLRDLVGPTPSAAEIAATAKPSLFREHGTLIGRALHSLGFNVDLAPVLDLALSPALPVMGTRVVSDDPARVAAYAKEFLAGLAQHGVLGCGKHFPGLGGGALDSHHATPRIARRWEQIWQQDLQPYRTLLSKLPLVMVNHAAYPEIEDPPLPASLSRFWIKTVLRDKLGYRGLVISDDMEMGGVLNYAPLEEAAIAAIAAGSDLIEICHRADRVLATHEALLREAERSRAFAGCVQKASVRVANAKRRLLKTSPPARALTRAGLKKLQDAQQRLRKRIALVERRSGR